MNERFLYVALDDNNREGNLALAEQLALMEGKFGFKINLDHVYLWGQQYIDLIQALEKPVFVDLKMFNGDRTMANIVENAVERQISHINVWAMAERLIKPLSEITQGSRTKLLGVTVTTHYDDNYCFRHFGKSLRETVRHFSSVALENGCDGIILPGTTLEAVKELDCIKVVPAIRPEWYKDKHTNEQMQPVTPSQAIEGGASILVCGSPIRRSSNPTEALKQVLSELN